MWLFNVAELSTCVNCSNPSGSRWFLWANKRNWRCFLCFMHPGVHSLSTSGPAKHKLWAIFPHCGHFLTNEPIFVKQSNLNLSKQHRLVCSISVNPVSEYSQVCTFGPQHVFIMAPHGKELNRYLIMRLQSCGRKDGYQKISDPVQQQQSGGTEWASAPPINAPMTVLLKCCLRQCTWSI